MKKETLENLINQAKENCDKLDEQKKSIKEHYDMKMTELDAEKERYQIQYDALKAHKLK